MPHLGWLVKPECSFFNKQGCNDYKLYAAKVMISLWLAKYRMRFFFFSFLSMLIALIFFLLSLYYLTNSRPFYTRICNFAHKYNMVTGHNTLTITTKLYRHIMKRPTWLDKERLYHIIFFGWHSSWKNLWMSLLIIGILAKHHHGFCGEYALTRTSLSSGTRSVGILLCRNLHLRLRGKTLLLAIAERNMRSASSASSISSLPLHLIWRSSSQERAICFCFAPSGSFACFACSACSVFSMKVISFWNRCAGVSTRFWSISFLSLSWSPASAHWCTSWREMHRTHSSRI